MPISSTLDPSVPLDAGEAGERQRQRRLSVTSLERVEAIESLEDYTQVHNLKHVSRLQDMTSASPTGFVAAYLQASCCKPSSCEQVVKLGKGGGPGQFVKASPNDRSSAAVETGDKGDWESTLEDSSADDRPTMLLRQFKGLPSRGCRKEERWVEHPGEAVADDDLESNFETKLEGKLDAVGTVFQRHALELEKQCVELERRCFTAVGDWYEEAVQMLDDKYEELL